MDWLVGDIVSVDSRMHGSMQGEIEKLTKWRHKRFAHMKWTRPGTGEFLMYTKSQIGKNDSDFRLVSRRSEAMPTKQKRRRWTVLFSRENRYLSDPSGYTSDIAWTYDLKEVEEAAMGLEGIVVDAKWLAEHWGDWKKTGEIPDWARPKPKELD